MLNMFDAEARVVQTADGLVPAEFLGMDRFDARAAVVAQGVVREAIQRYKYSRALWFENFLAD